MSSIPPPSADESGSLPSRPELPDGVWRPEPPPRPQDRPWELRVPLWSPLAVALAAFVLASIAYAAIAAIAGLSASEASNSPGPVLGATFVQDGLLIAGAALVVGRAVSSGAAARWAYAPRASGRPSAGRPPCSGRSGWPAACW